MNKELYRMQMLAGIITEGQYKEKLNEFDLDQFLKDEDEDYRNISSNSSETSSFMDNWNEVPDNNKKILKKSTGKEPILIMASSKGSNYLIAKDSNNKFYLYTFRQASYPGEPKGPFNSKEDAKNQVK